MGVDMVASIVAPLFVPGDRPDRFAAADASGADAIVLDLEDAIPPSAKDIARSAIRTNFTRRPVLVRINAIGTQWHAADVQTVVQHSLAALVLAKAEPGPGLESLCNDLPIPVIALIETARGLAGARVVAETAGVARLAFGPIDYSYDIGCAHSRAALHSARCELVLASRLGGLPPPIDGVTSHTQNEGIVEDDASHAKELGFGGKLAIHPRQIAGIYSGFIPSKADIKRAKAVLEIVEGVGIVDGTMVDEPVRMQARHVLRRAELIEAKVQRKTSDLSEG